MSAWLFLHLAVVGVT